MLTLKLFGAPTLEGPDAAVTGRGVRGPRLGILAVLALSRGRPVSRDRLAALLWPEADTQRARAQLSDALYLIRSVLGENAILATGDGLVLNPDVVGSDVAEFERLRTLGQLETAVGLVAGPLLDGFHLAGAAEFDHWISRERAELGDRYATVLQVLAEQCEARHEAAEAVRWWRRLDAHDPGSGRVALRLMRALEAAGDRAGALRYARGHAEFLRREFDADPDTEVAALEELLRHEPAGRPVPAPAPAPFPIPPVAAVAAVAGPASIPSEPPRPDRRRWALVAIPLLALSLWFGTRLIGSENTAAPRTPSVGVLPFLNLSTDPEHVYFSDGLSEQVIAALSRIENLRVAARSSSFALRDRSLDVRTIGDTLGVETVLEGSVRRDGERLRVSARLSDAATGYQLWSEEYDRQLADIFVVQDEIARAIAGALELRLAGRPSPVRTPTPGLVAYDHYLRGLYLRNSLSGEALRQAVVHFDRAIALEPEFALAHAAKASVIAPLIYFGELPLEPGVAELRAVTARALELDLELGETHAALGILKLFFEWDWDGAGKALRKAIALNLNDAHAYHHLANYLRAMGRYEEAVAARERSIELDPLNARTRFVMGADYLSTGRLEQAIEAFRRASQLDPVNPLALGFGPNLPSSVALVYLAEGRTDEAAEALLRVALLRNASPRELEEMRQAHAAGGMAGFWRAWEEMEIRQFFGAPNTLRITAIRAMMGDTARALDGLERAHLERNPGLIYLRADPAFASLRSHARFQAVVRGMRLPDS